MLHTIKMVNYEKAVCFYNRKYWKAITENNEMERTHKKKAIHRLLQLWQSYNKDNARLQFTNNQSKNRNKTLTIWLVRAFNEKTSQKVLIHLLDPSFEQFKSFLEYKLEFIELKIRKNGILHPQNTSIVKTILYTLHNLSKKLYQVVSQTYALAELENSFDKMSNILTSKSSNTEDAEDTIDYTTMTNKLKLAMLPILHQYNLVKHPLRGGADPLRGGANSDNKTGGVEIDEDQTELIDDQLDFELRQAQTLINSQREDEEKTEMIKNILLKLNDIKNEQTSNISILTDILTKLITINDQFDQDLIIILQALKSRSDTAATAALAAAAYQNARNTFDSAVKNDNETLANAIEVATTAVQTAVEVTNAFTDLDKATTAAAAAITAKDAAQTILENIVGNDNATAAADATAAAAAVAKTAAAVAAAQEQLDAKRKDAQQINFFANLALAKTSKTRKVVNHAFINQKKTAKKAATAAKEAERAATAALDTVNAAQTISVSAQKNYQILQNALKTVTN